MDFGIPSVLQKTLDEMGEIVARELYPLEAHLGTKAFVDIEPQLQDVRREVKRRGLWAPQVPKELGGMGLSLVEHGLVSAVLGRVLAK